MESRECTLLPSFRILIGCAIVPVHSLSSHHARASVSADVL